MKEKPNEPHTSRQIFFTAWASSVVCSVVLLSGCTGQITEKKIVEVLDGWDDAAKFKNIEGAVAHMADDVEIEVTIRAGDESSSGILTLNQYKMALQESFNNAEAMDVGHKNTRITIAPDGKTAMASYNTYGTVAINGQAFRTGGEETAIFKVRWGKIVVTSLQSVQEVML